jgi:hypothetical protein
MSLELKVNTNFKVSIDFIKDRVKSNLVETRNRGNVTISERDFNTVLSLIDASFDQASIGAFKQVDGLIKDLKKEYGD